MRRFEVLIGLALAASAVTGTAAAAPDPCALVTPSDLRALASNATVGSGTVDRQPELGATICTYQWGPAGNAASGHFNFHVTVSEIAKVFPGTSRETIKEGLLAQTKKPDGSTVAIPGVGDAAIYSSETPIRSDATALVKSWLLLVDLDGPDGRGKKDQVIALLKTAAGRL